MQVRAIQWILFSSALLLFWISSSNDLNAESDEIVTTTMAQKRLATIVTDEQELFRIFKEEPEKYSQSDMDYRVRSLIADYELYISDNPEDEEAYILLGKLFRRVNRPEKAHELYLRADRFNGSIPVVKQQLANYFAETGRVKKANDYLNQAIFLSPDEPLYHYQYGTFLFFYKDEILEKDILSRSDLDTKMLESFQMAHKLDPDNRKYLERYAQSFYDVEQPNWKYAVELWDELLKNPDSELERQALKLQKARAVFELGDIDMAKYLVNQVEDPSLQFSREELISIMEDRALKAKLESTEIKQEEIARKVETISDSVIPENESLEETIARLKKKHNIQTSVYDNNLEIGRVEQSLDSKKGSILEDQLDIRKNSENQSIEVSKNQIHEMPVDWPGFLEEEKRAFEGLVLRQIDRRKDTEKLTKQMRKEFESLLKAHVMVMKGNRIKNFDRVNNSYSNNFQLLDQKSTFLVDEMSKALQSLLALEKHLKKKEEYISQKGWDISRVEKMMDDFYGKTRRARIVFKNDFEEALELQVNVKKSLKAYYSFKEDHDILESLANR